MEMINTYISKRYPYWLDYANYHATLASLTGQGGDILHTVLESLLGKDPEYLQGLYEKKKQGYTELDFYILRMMKLNAHSLTSPYRHKNRGLPKDANADPWLLEIIDEEPEGESYNERILRLMRKSREILADLDIPQRDKEIFSWKFYSGNSLRSLPGEESYASVCSVYNRVCDELMGAISPERLRIHTFCKTFVKVRSRLQRAA